MSATCLALEIYTLSILLESNILEANAKPKNWPHKKGDWNDNYRVAVSPDGIIFYSLFFLFIYILYLYSSLALMSVHILCVFYASVRGHLLGTNMERKGDLMIGHICNIKYENRCRSSPIKCPGMLHFTKGAFFSA